MSTPSPMEAPAIPDWVARDPSVRPGAVGPGRARTGERIAVAAYPGFETSLDEAPTFPTTSDETDVPTPRKVKPVRQPASLRPTPAAEAAAAVRIPVVSEESRDDWMLVAVGVGLTASLLTLLLMLAGGYGSL